jgi:hypothetical protein
VTDPGGATSGEDRVIRGGSYADSAAYIRSAFRRFNTPSGRGGLVGFRVLRSADIENQKSATVSVGPRINVALASNGGVAKASSTEDGSVSGRQAAFPVASVIDGDRKGMQWGNKGGWNDGTPGTYPDWVEIEFKGSPTIDEIRVFTLQDKPENAVEPDEPMTFSLWGITSFEVQSWNGSGWVTVPNGKIAKNNKVYNRFAFPGLVTSRIRVVVYSAMVDFSRIIEVEAWGTQPISN